MQLTTTVIQQNPDTKEVETYLPGEEIPEWLADIVSVEKELAGIEKKISARKNQISSVFHYFPLHLSPYFKNKHDGRSLPRSEFYSKNLLRLPLYYELTLEQVNMVTENINRYFSKVRSPL